MSSTPPPDSITTATDEVRWCTHIANIDAAVQAYLEGRLVDHTERLH